MAITTVIGFSGAATAQASAIPSDPRASMVVSTIAGGTGYGSAASVDLAPLAITALGDKLWILDSADYGTALNPRTHDALRAIDLATGTESVLADEADPHFPQTAQLVDQRVMAAAPDGTLYFSSPGSHRLYKWTSAAGVTVAAGSGQQSSGASPNGACGPPPVNPMAAIIPDPQDIAVGSDGSVYLAFSCSIWRLHNNQLSQFAGAYPNDLGHDDGDGGQATAANFSGIRGIDVTPAGIVYVASAAAVRKIDTTGVVTSIAGRYDNTYGPAPTADGIPALGSWINADDVLAHADGTVDIIDQYHQNIRRVETDGTIQTVASGVGAVRLIAGRAGRDTWLQAGTSGRVLDELVSPGVTAALPVRIDQGEPLGCCHSGDGGRATSGRLSAAANGLPADGLIVDPTGDVIFSDNGYIREITPSGILHTLAGNRTTTNDPATGSGLTMNIDPHGLAQDGLGDVFFVDSQTGRLEQLNPAGLVTTIAVIGQADSIARDSRGNIYANNINNSEIAKITPTGQVSCYASCPATDGYGSSYGDGGPAAAAALASPHGLAMDATDDLFVIEGNLHQDVRRIDANGTIWTAANFPGAGHSGGGYPIAESEFVNAQALTPFGPADFVVADGPDLYSFRQGKGSQLTSLDAVPGYGGFRGDGAPAYQALFGPIQGLAHDSAGSIYVDDVFNGRIRKLTAPVDPIAAKYASLGGARSGLGAPVGHEYVVAGGTAQSYRSGRILYSRATGAHEVDGAIAGRYAALGGPGALGLPTTDGSYSYQRKGRFNSFTRATIYWTSATGAHAVTASFLATYTKLGKEHGSLGYPTRDAYSFLGLQVIDFQHGHLIYNPKSHGITVIR